MTKPRKPWRLILTGPEVRAQSDHGSETAAYSLMHTALKSDDSPADTGEVRHWEDGRWVLYERITADELP
ncbi:hypothetical protein [Streptomyces sp. NPDC003877]